MRRLLSLLALAPAAGLALHVPACDGGTYVYPAHVYDTTRDCMAQATASVDVLSGDPPGECSPACILQASSDGGRQVFVSTMCAPYPPQVDVSGKDPVCTKALAAFARNDRCLEDGGSSSPAPVDAGTD